MRNILISVILSVGTWSCIDTGQNEVSFPLLVEGTQRVDPVLTMGDVPVTIDRADLAFGPLVLCAGTSAGDLCDTARAEWLDSVIVDTLSAEPVQAGLLEGVSGPVRSWMYDLGISSQLTAEDPDVLDAARELGSTSLVVEARAILNGIEVPVYASIAVQQTGETELGVPVVRKSLADRFDHDITGQESSLVIRFDPATWIRGIDLSSFIEHSTCETASRDIVCNGAIELSCDAGRETDRRDCTATQQFCQKRVGCSDAIVIERESQPYRSIRNALLSGVRPTFSWSMEPSTNNGD